MPPPPTPPPPPEVPPAAVEEEAVMVSITIAIGTLVGGLVIGLVIGFLVGTRAKQLSAAIKNIPRAVATIAQTKKAAKEQQAAGDDGQAETVDPEDDHKEVPTDPMVAYLNSLSVPGLDDHPDIEFNPIILYRIKQMKEEQRKARLAKQQQALGLAASDADGVLAMVQADAGASYKVLIAAGARFNPVSNANAAHHAQQDKRRQLRSVDTYLQKRYEVDIARVEPPAHDKTRLLEIGAQNKVMVKDAMKSSKPNDRIERNSAQVVQAKSARFQLRELHRTRPLPIVYSFDDDELGADTMPPEIGELSDPHEKGMRRQATMGRHITAEDMALITMEMAAEDDLEGVDDEGGNE